MEFHGLVQCKVKARFGGRNITYDAGGFAVAEVEKRIGPLAGLAGCFRNHRDSRLIEHTTFDNISLNGSRVYNRMC